MNKQPVLQKTKKYFMGIAFFLLICPIASSQEAYYGPAPRVEWINTAFSSIGISYYPATTTTNFNYNSIGNTSSNSTIIAFDYRTLFYHPLNYSPLTLGLSIDGFISSTPSSDYNLQYSGGALNFCFFHLPRNFYQRPVSFYEGVELGLNYVDAVNNVSSNDPNYESYNNYFINLKASIGLIMFLDKTSREALSIDLGYNFDQYTFPDGNNMTPGYFVRLAFCFGRGARYVAY